jgi:hypothetical protein
VSVSVGSWSDPPSVPGLAHFLEHLLFMGSAKYPLENELDTFLSSHGGHSNAHTELEYTCYEISVLPAHLHGGMDRSVALLPRYGCRAVTRTRVSSNSGQSCGWPCLQACESVCEPAAERERHGAGAGGDRERVQSRGQWRRRTTRGVCHSALRGSLCALPTPGTSLRLCRRCAAAHL